MYTKTLIQHNFVLAINTIATLFPALRYILKSVTHINAENTLISPCIFQPRYIGRLSGFPIKYSDAREIMPISEA